MRKTMKQKQIEVARMALKIWVLIHKDYRYFKVFDDFINKQIEEFLFENDINGKYVLTNIENKAFKGDYEIKSDKFN
jgi:hypothetical protein